MVLEGDVAQHCWRYGLSLVKINIAISEWCHGGNVRCKAGWSVMGGAWVLTLILWLPIFYRIRILHFVHGATWCWGPLINRIGSSWWMRTNQEHTNLCDSCQCHGKWQPWAKIVKCSAFAPQQSSVVSGGNDGYANQQQEKIHIATEVAVSASIILWWST